MKYRGRLIASSIILPIHTAYMVYYYFRDGHVDIADLAAYPLLAFLSYWAGLQYDKAVYYSDMDTLTDLYNRRFMIKAFDKIKAFANRMDGNLFLLVIDCDNFKYINDHYGHAKGDQVLSAIGKTLIKSTRDSDLVARWGGDEFVIVGHYKDGGKGLEAMLHRLEGQLAELSGRMKLPISVSIGSAVFPTDGADLDQLLRIADENMYVTKRARKASQA
ncbi:diguanylate cyclase (GGDEF)-like protein [Paenibacillus phyllosphaerae]|uniref:Diguanylate cyclase (GGDEF)-like protein n=1 Tax=Paenibacillus phyllosphaerae TaxID=274593 RepID=A0A7W5B1B9_9BACL|nr:GGDEF domain-containing protein [Paenibacillus phyllosphaerae]MBB3111891.1 diguanylate cyclase (GGDEF)-like protein [Paenibacillus phyllosphaerae]